MNHWYIYENNSCDKAVPPVESFPIKISLKFSNYELCENKTIIEYTLQNVSNNLNTRKYKSYYDKYDYETLQQIGKKSEISLNSFTINDGNDSNYTPILIKLGTAKVIELYNESTNETFRIIIHYFYNVYSNTNELNIGVCIPRSYTIEK